MRPRVSLSVNGKPYHASRSGMVAGYFSASFEIARRAGIEAGKRDMNMNIVRSEGKLEDDGFYDLCDKYGLLVMSGWMCCGAWQYPERWDAAKRSIAMSSDSSVMYWLT